MSAPTSEKNRLREKLTALLAQWQTDGLPGRASLHQIAGELADWKKAQVIEGLWPEAPLFMSATLDDGFGHGIATIGQFAELAGMRRRHLGEMAAVETILAAACEEKPAVLGITVLQLDSDDDLAGLCRGLPAEVTVVAGGAALMIDADMAGRTGVDVFCRDLRDFLAFLLKADFGG